MPSAPGRGRPASAALSGVAVAGLVAVLACVAAAAPHAAGVAADTTHVMLGADISALAAPLSPGQYFPPYQEHGKASDELTILERHGWNAYRLRVFVSPTREAPDNSLENTIPLAKRIKASGATFLLDIHYSDTWADPQHQETPVAWRGRSFDSLEQQVETYSRNTIAAFKQAGAMPDWVQVGNEITNGMLWPQGRVYHEPHGQDIQSGGPPPAGIPADYDSVTQWDHLTRLIKAGIKGVNEGAGDTPPRIVIHIDRGGDWTVTKWFFDHLQVAHVPYDIIGESFYPPWEHGSLADLWQTMQGAAQRYGKDFLVAETGYTQSHASDNPDMMWPVTPQGRLQFMADLINTVDRAPRGIGVMYWAPEWDGWNADGSPAPMVFVLDSLNSLRTSPYSHIPPVAGGG